MKPQPTAPPAPASASDVSTVKVVSDGNPFNTHITVNGEPLTNVLGIHWDLEAGGESRMVMDFDWIDVEYEGGWVKTFSRPTLREVLGMWRRGKKRPR